jgi:hypothetical protein
MVEFSFAHLYFCRLCPTRNPKVTAKSRDDRTRENRAADQGEVAISARVKKGMTSIAFNQIQ